MAQVDASDKKLVGRPNGNASEKIRVVYDFSEDAGAFADTLTLIEAEAGEDLAVRMLYVRADEAVASAGSPTIDVGIDGGDADVYVAAAAPAALGTGALLVPTSSDYQKLSGGGKIDMDIKVADLTAGKIECVFEVMKM